MASLKKGRQLAACFTATEKFVLCLAQALALRACARSKLMDTLPLCFDLPCVTFTMSQPILQVE
jgi:hypothetical protein